MKTCKYLLLDCAPPDLEKNCASRKRKPTCQTEEKSEKAATCIQTNNTYIKSAAR